MRATRLAGIVASVIVLASTAPARPAETHTITVPEVDVRSGPSLQYYATGKLRQGQRVQVLREENGWLAITPPADSFSWVNTRHVKEEGQTVYVVSEDTPIRIGSRVHNQEPTVQQVKVSRGSQLIIVGKAVAGSEGTWLPVQPPAAEVRYIPADAIKPAPAAAPPTTTTSSFPPPGAVPAAGAVPLAATSQDPRWAQAAQADQAGNAAEAIRLYMELAKEVKASNPGLAVQCYERAEWLRNGGRAQPGTAVASNPAGRSTSQYAYTRDASPPAGQTPVTPQASVPGPGASTASMIMRSGPGRLYRPSFQVDGKPIYGLDQGAGRPPMYVTPQPGLSLEPYLNRNVELYGTVTYRGDLRTNYMTAVQVIQLP